MIEKILEKIFTWFRGLTWIPEWMREGNREKHFILAIPCGFIFTILFVLGIATGMEFKDVQHAGMDWKAWDWLDWVATILGGLLGCAGRWIIIGIIIACV